MSIPVIDLSGSRRGDRLAMADAARQADQALRDVGFFTIVGHSVPADLLASVRRAACAFFDQPPAAKLRSGSASGSISRGYVALGQENLGRTLDNGDSRIDLKEQLAFGPLDAPPDVAEPNVWPEFPGELARLVRAYYLAMQDLAADVLSVLATALDMPPDFFRPYFARHGNVLRLLHYPDQRGQPPRPGETRSGEHTDYGALTLLMADDAAGGLQVRLRNGGWIDVAPPPGAFVVNIGDLMAMWTNDRWVSNLHRVVNPPLDAGRNARRLSAAYFANPDPGALIECIPTCADTQAPSRYPPVLAGVHRASKIARSRNPAPPSGRA